jgi:hypothetical protein
MPVRHILESSSSGSGLHCAKGTQQKIREVLFQFLFPILVWNKSSLIPYLPVSCLFWSPTLDCLFPRVEGRQEGECMVFKVLASHRHTET